MAEYTIEQQGAIYRLSADYGDGAGVSLSIALADMPAVKKLLAAIDTDQPAAQPPQPQPVSTRIDPPHESPKPHLPIELDGRIVTYNGRKIRLSNHEAILLQCIIDFGGRASHAEIAEAIWGDDTRAKNGGPIREKMRTLNLKLEQIRGPIVRGDGSSHVITEF